MSTTSAVTENIDKATIERLLTQHASESVSVSPLGTTASTTNVSLDQAIKGLEYIRKTQARSPFSQMGLAKIVTPSAID